VEVVFKGMVGGGENFEERKEAVLSQFLAPANIQTDRIIKKVGINLLIEAQDAFFYTTIYLLCFVLFFFITTTTTTPILVHQFVVVLESKKLCAGNLYISHFHIFHIFHHISHNTTLHNDTRFFLRFVSGNCLQPQPF
jgi:hypothetical protein